jgi:hypothetical protein
VLLRTPLEVVVTGSSMRPLVPDGARVRARPCHPDELRPGQIALFRHERGLVVHRVVATRRSPRPEVAERGDAAAVLTWRGPAAVVGLVDGVWLGDGYLDLRRGPGAVASALLDGRWRWRRVPGRLRRLEYALVEAALRWWAGWAEDRPR